MTRVEAGKGDQEVRLPIKEQSRGSRGGGIVQNNDHFHASILALALDNIFVRHYHHRNSLDKA